LRISPRDLIGLWFFAFAASAAVGTHGILYWDAGDYVTLAIEGGRSGLLLGRPLFLLVSRAIVHSGIDPAWAEPALRWFWTGVGAFAAPAMAVLAFRLGLDRRAAWLAGAMLAVSPSVAHTAHQVLTDAPALALSIAALAAAASGRALLSGVLLATAILTRETAAIHLVAVILLLGLRQSAVAVLSAAGVIAATLWMFPPAGLLHWVTAMSQSAGARPVSAESVGLSIVWMLAAGPVPVVAGIFALVRNPNRRMLFVAVPAAFATVALLFYPDGSFSPRYMLAAVPVAFFVPAAPWLSAWRWLIVLALAIPLALVPVATRASRAVAARGAVIQDRVQMLPARSLVVPGHYCPQARLGAAIGKRGDLGMLCPGWDWPADPGGALDAALAEGRPVAVALDAGDWWGAAERTNFEAVSAWARGKQGRDVAGFLVVGR
jgi:hypothetical protein